MGERRDYCFDCLCLGRLKAFDKNSQCPAVAVSFAGMASRCLANPLSGGFTKIHEQPRH